MKEEHRDRRSVRWLENAWRDAGYGLASLGRDPGFAAVVVGVLALGIGANVAMFGLLDAVMLKPLPFGRPDRIVRIWEAPRPGVTNSTTAPDFLDWRRMATSFEALAAESPISMALTGAGEPVRLDGRAVTAEFFRVFDAGIQLGRTFQPRDVEPGQEAVVVLSNATWQTVFGADPSIVNRNIQLDGQPYQVIGVLRPGAFDRSEETRFWKPLVLKPGQYKRGMHWLMVHGRLQPNVTPLQARDEMRRIALALRDVTPAHKHTWLVEVVPLQTLLLGESLRRTMYLMFGAVVLVLLIASANIANLLLGKGAARRKEMAIRTALGASRVRLAAQLLTETLVLAVLGGAAGLMLASALVNAAAPFLAEMLPYTAELAVDYRALAFAGALVSLVALTIGGLPAMQISTANLGSSLQQASRGSSGRHHRIRRLIVVTEVGLSLVLVCGACLLFRSLLNLQAVETGVRIENVVTMSLNLPSQAYPTPAAAAMFYESLRDRLKSIPGVSQAALSTHLPLRWIGNGEAIELPGREEPVNVRFKRVDAGYLNAFSIPLLAGRGISEQDRYGSSRVIVINEALAARLADIAGIRNPVGLRVGLYCPVYGDKRSATEQVEIVGVIRNERVAAPGVPHPPIVYVPLSQVASEGVKLIVRADIDSASVIAGVREALRDVDPHLPIGDIATMREVRERTLAGTSRPAWLIGIFAGIAALLAAIGLYGVISQTVNQRRREIGIRIALGARASDVLGHVLKDASKLVLIGLVIGAVGASAVTRLAKALLFGVSPLDPVAFVVACAAMAFLGILAGLIPAGRAARLDPVVTLREEG
ncbi:MAG: ABC transporter permease [Bryobacterales bacterium]|nr:ABC transporter permease [Bryobacterales bacterium]